MDPEVGADVTVGNRYVTVGFPDQPPTTLALPPSEGSVWRQHP